jgi:hypothetical protein
MFVTAFAIVVAMLGAAARAFRAPLGSARDQADSQGRVQFLGGITGF